MEPPILNRPEGEQHCRNANHRRHRGIEMMIALEESLVGIVGMGMFQRRKRKWHEKESSRRNLSTTLRHFANQCSEPSFPWPSAPSPGSAPSTSLTGSARLIQTSALSSAARGGPATKRSGRAA